MHICLPFNVFATDVSVLFSIKDLSIKAGCSARGGYLFIFWGNVCRTKAQNLCVTYLKSFSVFKLETRSDIIKCFSQSDCCSSFLRLGEVHFDRHDSTKLTSSSSILSSSWSSLTSKVYFWIICIVEHRLQSAGKSHCCCCLRVKQQMTTVSKIQRFTVTSMCAMCDTRTVTFFSEYFLCTFIGDFAVTVAAEINSAKKKMCF